MNRLRFGLIPCLALLLTACTSTPETRIADNRTAFEALPADAQSRVKAGRVEPGDTAEMVRLALGEPMRKFSRRTSEAGAGEAEIWVYPRRGPRFSFGLGVGGGSGGTGYGAGLGMSTGGGDPDEGLRVELRDGKVVSLEFRKR